MYLLKSRQFISLMLAVLFMSSWLVAPQAGAAAAAQANASSEINRTLAEISRAERNDDYHLLYDLMLPEARMLIPRMSFINWWPTIAPAAPADVLEINSLDFEDITYELTDTEFGNVAVVNYSYHDAEGNALDRTMRLAEIGGVWRWMPDVTQDELPEIRAQDVYTVNFNSAFSSEIYRDLDTFWAQIFADWGKEYRSPVDMIGVRVEGTDTGCGPIDDLDMLFAQYCTRDETIYFNPEMRDVITENYGAAAWEMIMAHEWAHHIQNISGMYVTKSPELFGGNYTIEHELMADCLAGVFMQDTIASGFFDTRSVREMDMMIRAGGDSSGTRWDDITAHGTDDQRQQSLHTGFDDGLRGCRLRP